MKFTFNPLKTCILRTVGLSSSRAATFGMVRTNPDGTKRAHQGIDLASDIGYRCYAVEDGTVVMAERALSGYGLVLSIRLNCPKKPELHGKYAFYAHLSLLKFKIGDKVKAGDVLALTGDTGNANGMDTIAEGAHLHFELRTELRPGLGLGGRVNPQPYIEFIG